MQKVEQDVLRAIALSNFRKEVYSKFLVEEEILYKNGDIITKLEDAGLIKFSEPSIAPDITDKGIDELAAIKDELPKKLKAMLAEVDKWVDEL